ncbi:hypothetical protein GLAREA_03134 [Glarea lozoyensis ATCC 20868]|uniref:Uncharacterized protein n=1 Tax=Glarea lozoyensis (strain ATCC 20868 / MF5171) TaxID=1116229 RepID=S3CQ08_GLAL2|nr:uncharacterized protein GLAREA_03134 [Glarea lozoyensis ATCC 20868]EPE27219.1 hypothetical protein GLAREA_03134 [Glarea lozoyensis ATCC 20868]
MQPSIPTSAFLFLCSFTSLVTAQVAAGGGAGVVSSIAASQYPVVTNAPSLFTINGVTSATNIVFTQTFAATALGGWPLGATPLAGAIGLGDIQGTIGHVKTKRELAQQTPSPVA